MKLKIGDELECPNCGKKDTVTKEEIRARQEEEGQPFTNSAEFEKVYCVFCGEVIKDE